MKTINKRAWVILVLAIVMLCTLCLLFVSIASNADTYALNAVDGHLYKSNVLINAGRVLDAKGQVLAQSQDGHRVYNDSTKIREAMLHVVGDSYGYISTGVQTTFRTELSGYSLIRGVVGKNGTYPDVTLTLNADLCAAAQKALGSYKGTIIIYNYKTGAIVCLATSPTYDPEDMPENMDNDPDYEGVYINRALKGLYVPGSVFKIVTACAAYENIPDIQTRTFSCDGAYETDGGTVICSGVHGTQTFTEAFGNSCNCAFAEIADELGADKLKAEADKLGLTQAYEIDRVQTAQGTFDATGTTKADLGWAGIGQYTTLVNPCSMMMLAGAIANGGTPVMPYYVASAAAGSSYYYKAKTVNGNTYMTADAASFLQSIMRSNIVNYYGDFGLPDLQLCAKTGTAETGDGKEPHAWFCGFCSNPDTPYAFAAVLENSGSGKYYAGNAVAKVLKTMLIG